MPAGSTPKRIAIAMFCDAAGWDVIGSRPWFLKGLSSRRKVRSVFGYSSACIPAIFTGRKPNENGHWGRAGPVKAVRRMERPPAVMGNAPEK